LAKGSVEMASEPLKEDFSAFNKNKKLNILKCELQQETVSVLGVVHLRNF